MHIPDGFLNDNLTVGMLAGAFCMLVYCLSKIFKVAIVRVNTFAVNNASGSIAHRNFKLYNTDKYFQKLATIALWVFSFHMFNIPIQSTTSAHLIGGVFASVIAGPFAGFMIISSVLIIQSLFFSDGGILALGANIFNMAFIGSFISYYIYTSLSLRNYHLAIIVACFFSILVASLFCLIELWISGALSFTTMAFKNIMGLHLIVAPLETIITFILIKMFKNLL